MTLEPAKPPADARTLNRTLVAPLHKPDRGVLPLPFTTGYSAVQSCSPTLAASERLLEVQHLHALSEGRLADKAVLLGVVGT